MMGMWTLFLKEIRRFWKVAFQTIAAPVMTALLYLLIFGQVLQDRVTVYNSVDYVSFLVPGLVMMSVLQNAFANSSSSLIQSKIMGSLIFVLLTPLTALEILFAYVGAAIVRGLVVGLGVLAATIWFVHVEVAHWLWMFLFLFMGAAIMGTMGLIAGIWAEKFDQIAAFQNFIIMPATFLSGVFYSIHSLPAFWQVASQYNPFFYMIDGFRYGFFGQSDVAPWLSLTVVATSLCVLLAIAIGMLQRGYKLRH